jgi:xeroderma pigmentosum group C-complementing protein
LIVEAPDSDLKYPIFWSEVYLNGKWIPIDAIVLNLIATTPQEIEQFEPKGKLAEVKKLVMGYVVAYDSGTCSCSANPDRLARDVTVRYVKKFPGKAKRWRVLQIPFRGIDGDLHSYDWFHRALGVFRRTEKSV